MDGDPGRVTPKTLANSYSGLSLADLGGGNWRLTSYTSGPGIGEIGYAFNFHVVPVPPAVWLFGSALGLLGAARRRSTA